MRVGMPDIESLERLSDPPIVEVACGCIFGEIPQIDPLMLGAYWRARRADFPDYELQPAIFDPLPVTAAGPAPLMIRQGVPPTRTWLVSASKEFLVQIQSDRFYVNWRKQGGRYPSFSSSDGVRLRTLDEFGRFREYCQREIGMSPTPFFAQLSKVDHIVEGKHWKTFAELAAMVPWLRDFNSFSHSGEPSVSMRFGEGREGGQVTVALDLLAAGSVVPPAPGRVLKIETTATKGFGGGAAELDSALRRVNLEVNDIFAKLVPKTSRDANFQPKGP